MVGPDRFRGARQAPHAPQERSPRCLHQRLNAMANRCDSAHVIDVPPPGETRSRRSVRQGGKRALNERDGREGESGTLLAGARPAAIEPAHGESNVAAGSDQIGQLV
jgi:hypothetical protein